MDLIEALEWLAGKRSMTNIIPQDPFETWQVRICQADAAMTEQAYLVVKAHNESLLNADKSAIVRVQELEAQLAAAQEQGVALNNDLYYALELVIAYAHSAADQEWASKRIDELKPPERELPAPPEQEADHDN